jgi:hypothetical protein
MLHQPPRLVLGCALLFWGAMTGRPLLALIMALAVEGSHWTRVRWDFDDTACGRAWRICVVAILIAAVLIWLDGNRYNAMPVLLSWMPLLLMPMQFIQSYGMRAGVPVSEFSFLAKRRRERNQRFGLEAESGEFNFGNVLFTTSIVAASVGSEAYTWLFLPGIVILSGWMLMSAGRARPWLLAPVLLVAGLLAFGGRVALERAEEWLGRATGERGTRGFDPNFSHTLIGRPGTVRQSPEIIWRLWTDAPGDIPPRLLRTASFNTFLGTNWQNQRVTVLDFQDLDTRLIDDVPYYTLGENAYDGTGPPLPSYRLRGSADAETPLPLPGDAAALRDFALDGVECNSFGTVRVYPSNPVIEGAVLWRGDGNPESPPIPDEDLRIPLAERDTILATREKLGITPETPLAEALDRLRVFFHRDFSYTRNLSISHSPYRVTGPTAITKFLDSERTGHCEYFATAAALILRDAGVPARYATGYAVIERDFKRGVHVIRGTHGHAWCRVWDEGSQRWIDFDPTPPDWLGSLANQVTRSQRIQDALQRLQEDFFLWRTRPENRLAVSIAMTVIGLALAAFLASRLWKSRRQLEHRSKVAEKQSLRTPLHDLEKPATRHLGVRPPGLPYAVWLAGLRPDLPDAGILDQAIALHQRLRFDPAPVDADIEYQLAELARQLIHSLASVPPRIAATGAVPV